MPTRSNARPTRRTPGAILGPALAALAALLLAGTRPAAALTEGDFKKLTESLGSKDQDIARGAMERLLHYAGDAGPELKEALKDSNVKRRARVRLVLLLAGKDASGALPEAAKTAALDYEKGASAQAVENVYQTIGSQGGDAVPRLLLVFAALYDLAAQDLGGRIRADASGKLADDAIAIMDGSEGAAALRILSAAHEAKKDFQKAVEFMARALAAAPGDSIAPSELARLMNAHKNLQGVIPALEKAWEARRDAEILKHLLSCYERAGDVESSTSRIENHLKRSPTDLAKLAPEVERVFKKTKEWNRGVELFRGILENSKTPEAARLLAVCQEGAGNFKKAADALRLGMVRYPDDSRLEDDLVALAERAPNPDEILPSLGDKFKDWEPSEVAGEIEKHRSKGRHRIAFRIARQALLHNSKSKRLALLVGETGKTLGDQGGAGTEKVLADAAEALLKVWKEGNDDPVPVLKLADLLQQVPRCAPAYELFGLAYEKHKDEKMEEPLLTAARAQDDDDRVADIQAARLKGKDDASFTQVEDLAKAYQDARRFKEALDLLDPALKRPFKEGEIKQLEDRRHRMLVAAGKFEEALKGVEERWKNEPLKWLGTYIAALKGAEKLRPAAEAAEAQLREKPPKGGEPKDLNPSRKDRHNFVYFAYSELNDRAKEIEALQRLLEETEEADDLVRLGNLLLDQGEFEKAGRAFARGAVGFGEDARFPFMLAAADGMNGRKEAEGRVLERARKVAAGLPAADRERLCHFLYEQGIEDWADAELENLLGALAAPDAKTDQERANLLLGMAQRFEHAHKFKEAAERYTQLAELLRRHGREVDDLARLGRLYALFAEQNPDPAEFLDLAEKVNKAFPSQLEVSAKLYELYTSKGRKEDAQRVLDSTLAKEKKQLDRLPDDANLLNNIAWFYALCGTRLDEGIRMSEKSLQVEREQWAYLDTLAELHYRNGDPRKAMETIERALKVKPRDAYLKRQKAKFEKALK